MLWIERQVVATLTNPEVDDDFRSEIESYVDGSLRSMPEHLRAGVAAESILLGLFPLIQQACGRFDGQTLERRVSRWKGSRLDPIRQYVRLLQSLVLFAENELEPERGT